MHKHKKHRHILRSILLLGFSVFFFAVGVSALWVSTWKIPDISAFSERKVSQSTKIYDRTGTVLLYNLHGGEKRTVVPYSEISSNIKNAAVAIEDSEFWQHNGIRVKAIIRAVFSNLLEGNLFGGQGGSTITQQVVKNSLLTNEKKISRKLKEWVLARRLEQTFDKETILSLYLNEIPYGGTIYGIEQASQTFFGKSSRDLSLSESAYLAAIPNAPTYYSPYGNHRDKLEERKNLVLEKMLENNFITQDEFEVAKREVSPFNPDSSQGIIAPHFVMYVRQYLEEQYGKDALKEGGFTVITTLNTDLQAVAEEVVKKYALKNSETFDAENASLVALDPQTGQILTMVGSRDYFDKDIDGNFNVSLALRQPGSAIKPFVYAAAIRKGFTPETIAFDVPTEFSTTCNPDGTAPVGIDPETCYRPENYDGKYHGPISFRNALAQSVNIPAIQVLYLAGLKDSLQLAKDMGLRTLTDVARYGLTLVLGGGEVRLLDLTSGYATFASEGIRRSPQGILRVEKNGSTLEEWRDKSERVLEPNVALTISDMLSDNTARTPAFGATSPLYFPGHDVAVKTGTTNDFRDAWIIGYTPNLAVGAWAGNNDNRPMHKIAAYIVAPLWNEFMNVAMKTLPNERFNKPAEEDLSTLPPIMRGIWQGNQTYFVDKFSGKLATEFTPPELREERAIREVHSLLYSVDKNNPRIPRTTPPETDPQFPYWEYSARLWALTNGYFDESSDSIPKETDPYHTADSVPSVTFLYPPQSAVFTKQASISVQPVFTSKYPITKVNFFVNNQFVGSSSRAPWQITLTLSNIDSIGTTNELKAIAYDVVENRGENTVVFTVTE